MFFEFVAVTALVALSVLLTLLVICLCRRIMIGAKAVELGGMFLLNNCFLVVLPITQGFILIITLAGFVAGGISLLSLGDFSFPNNQPLPNISLNGGEIAMAVIFIIVGLWLVFFFHGSPFFFIF